jgi:hypothetical protein
LTKKPLLAIFNSRSPALEILKECGARYAYSYDGTDEIELKIIQFIKKVVSGGVGEQSYDDDHIQQYSAENVTRLQCEIFDQVISRTKNRK